MTEILLSFVLTNMFKFEMNFCDILRIIFPNISKSIDSNHLEHIPRTTFEVESERKTYRAGAARHSQGFEERIWGVPPAGGPLL